MLSVSELTGASWPPCADVRLRWPATRTRHLVFIYIYGLIHIITQIKPKSDTSVAFSAQVGYLPGRAGVTALEVARVSLCGVCMFSPCSLGLSSTKNPSQFR